MENCESSKSQGHEAGTTLRPGDVTFIKLRPLHFGAAGGCPPAAGRDGDKQLQRWLWTLRGVAEETGATFFS